MNAFLFVMMFTMHTPSAPAADVCLSGRKPIIRIECTHIRAPAPTAPGRKGKKPVIRN